MICNTEIGACEPPGDIVVAEGSGLLCAAPTGGSPDNKLSLAVLGLLGLAGLRRRLRRR
jgi:MYXO-CTERM domain-containing protein